MFGLKITKKNVKIINMGNNIIKKIQVINYGGSKNFLQETYYTKDENFIGNENSYLFCIKNGLSEIQPVDSKSRTCQIGFQKETNKWMGWSHRASKSFGIGDTYYGKSNSILKFPENTKRKIKTMEEAKQSAINFGNYWA